MVTVACLHSLVFAPHHYGLDGDRKAGDQDRCRPVPDQIAKAGLSWPAKNGRRPGDKSSNDACRAEELIRLCAAADSRFWLSGGQILAGWAAAVDGRAAGLQQMCPGMEAWQQGCVFLTRPHSLAIYAEACATFGLIADSRAALAEARRLAQVTGEHWYDADLSRISAGLAAACPIAL